MNALTAWWDSLKETQQQVDAKRREDMVYYFRMATAKKEYRRTMRPSNMGCMSLRTAPSATLDNWAAAWKVRRYWEDQTERRKAAGKVIY